MKQQRNVENYRFLEKRTSLHDDFKWLSSFLLHVCPSRHTSRHKIKWNPEIFNEMKTRLGK
jgi:hypothetical protein